MSATLDCSAITNDDLSRHVLGLWQFPQAIKYSFYGELTAQQAADMPASLQPPYESTPKFIAMMRQTMQYFQNFTNGLLQFEEVPFLKPEEPGILLNVCGSFKQFNTAIPNSVGISTHWYDSPGFFHRTIACFPQGYIEGGSSLSEATMYHEVLHALGASHFHDGKTGELLRQMPFSKACSVMPYPHLLNTAISDCPPEICPAGYATTPGPTDRQFIMAAYNQTNGWLPKRINQQMYVDVPMQIGTIYTVMLLRSAAKKMIHAYIDRQLEEETDEVSPLNVRAFDSLADITINFFSIAALIACRMNQDRDIPFLMGLAAVNLVGGALRLCEHQRFQQLGHLFTSDGLWHAFIGAVTMQQPLAMGGVAELASGIAHTAASIAGANSIDCFGSLFGKRQQPVLPVYCESTTPTRVKVL